MIRIDERMKKLKTRKYFRVKLDGIDRSSELYNFEGKAMGIYDIAILAECEQIVDVINQIRHNLEIDVKGLKDMKIPPGLSEYGRLLYAIEKDFVD